MNWPRTSDWCVGCARGIGQGIALAFAKTGAKLALFDLRGLNETLELVKKEGAEAKGWELDATNEEEVNKTIDEVEEQVGPIDILVHVAGIVNSRPVLMENYKNFWRTMEVNTGAVTSTIAFNLMLAYHFFVESSSIDEEAWKGNGYLSCLKIRNFGSSWRSIVRCQ